MFNNDLKKTLLMSAYGVLIDQFYLKEENLQKSLMFGGAIGVGNYASQFVVPIVNQIAVPSINKNLYDTKTLIERISEVGSSTALVYLVNKYLLNNDNYKGELYLRLGVIAVADFASTYTLEYMDGKPLEFLTKQ